MQSYGAMCNGLLQGMFCSLQQCEVTFLAYGKKSNQATEVSLRGNVLEDVNCGPYFRSHENRVAKHERENGTMRYNTVLKALFMF